MSNTRNLVIKIAKLSLLIVIVMAQVSSLSAFAVGEGGAAPAAESAEGADLPSDKEGTILPPTGKTVKDCKELMNVIENFGFSDEERKWLFSNDLKQDILMEGITFKAKDILGCGIKTGQIRLWMIPYYIRYILQFVIGIAGLVAVGGIVYGGYLYLFAGISDDKDKGKHAIIYSVAGMVLTLVAWVLVNIIISVVTA